jgi:hypothetical protein
MSMSVPAYVYVCLCGSDVFNLFENLAQLTLFRILANVIMGRWWYGGKMQIVKRESCKGREKST